MHNVHLEQQQHLILHHIDESVVDADIRVYLELSLGRFIRKRQLSTDDDEGDVLRELVKKAGSLFMWAATTYRFVLQGGPRARKRLDTILAGGGSAASSSPEGRFDAMYHSVLKTALREDFTADEVEETCQLLRTVLGSIAVMFSPLPAASLGSLFDLAEDEIRDTLCDLYSIINVPDGPLRPVRLHHVSVRDYVLSKQRCTDARFWIDEPVVHARLARNCLQLLGQSLHADMCSLGLPDARPSVVDASVMAKDLPPHIRYACQYWVAHVRQSQDLDSLSQSVYMFMQTHMLHWLETLSLLERLDDGVEMLGSLEMFFVSQDPATELSCDASSLTSYPVSRGLFLASVVR
jgi:hypothetical protein